MKHLVRIARESVQTALCCSSRGWSSLMPTPRCTWHSCGLLRAWRMHGEPILALAPAPCRAVASTRTQDHRWRPLRPPCTGRGNGRLAVNDRAQSGAQQMLSGEIWEYLGKFPVQDLWLKTGPPAYRCQQTNADR